MPDTSIAVTLRPIAADDEAFLYELYASTREEELSVVTWDAAMKEQFLRMQFHAQQTHYQGYYPNGEHQLILLDGQPIGRMYVAPMEQELRLLDIALLPEHRNRGIGTAMMQALMEEASRVAKPIRLHVYEYDPKALRFYARLGFVQIGKTGLHLFMEWPPQQPSVDGVERYINPS